jgi:hypothetical protein
MQGEIRKCSGIPAITVESTEERPSTDHSLHKHQARLPDFLNNANTSTASHSNDWLR